MRPNKLAFIAAAAFVLALAAFGACLEGECASGHGTGQRAARSAVPDGLARPAMTNAFGALAVLLAAATSPLMERLGALVRQACPRPVSGLPIRI